MPKRISLSRNVAILLLVTLLTGPGCRNRPDPDVMNPKDVADLLASSMLAAVTATNSDSVQTLDDILEEKGISRERFDASVDYYRGDNPAWLDILEETIRILENEKETMGKAGADSSR
jgi:hypothetical protein